jgi:hypothetical protein
MYFEEDLPNGLACPSISTQTPEAATEEDIQ